MAIISGIEEEILIQRLIDDDETAFELLFRFYYPGLVTFATQIVLDHDEAEELVEDFFVEFWLARKSIRKSSTLKSYFFTCIKNRALNYLKKVKVRKKIIEELQWMVETSQLYQPDLFVESELQHRINLALEKLPPRTSEIFKLSRFNGYSNTEIAEQFHISKRTVETQISNALKILREQLKDCQFLLLLSLYTINAHGATRSRESQAHVADIGYSSFFYQSSSNMGAVIKDGNLIE